MASRKEQKEQRRQRKIERKTHRKAVRKEKDRLILIAQKQRRKKKIEQSSIAEQRLSLMEQDYYHWVAEHGDANRTPPRLTVPATGAVETARTSAPVSTFPYLNHRCCCRLVLVLLRLLTFFFSFFSRLLSGNHVI
jgi:hypothetical protein